MLRMNELRQFGKYCDVTFIIGEHRFNCHKNILAAGTKYFDGMFGNDFKEADKRDVELKDIDEVGFKVLLEYVYTGKTELDKMTVKKVLAVASYFRVECLLEKCVVYIRDNINLENVLEYHMFADYIGCDSLKSYTMEFIQENFTTIAKSDDFLEITFTALKEFVSNDYTFVDKEEYMFDVIVRWVSHDWKSRSHYVADLIKDVRFKFVKPEYIFHEVLKHNLILEAIDRNIKIVIENSSADSSPRRSKKCIHMFGRRKRSEGFWEIVAVRLNSSSREIDRMNRKTDAVYFQTVISGGSTYMFTFNSQSKEKTFACFAANNEWVNLKIPEMNLPVFNIISLDSFNSIYANASPEVPPVTGNRDHNIYCYTTDLDSWNSIGASGYTASSGYNIHNASLVSYRDIICSCGGMDYNNSVLQVVRLLDPRIGKWIAMCSMLETSSYAASAVLNDRIYVTGGWTGSQNKNIVQMYDIIANKWQLVKPMNVNRHMHSLLPYQNKLYAIGGRSPMIEIYDPSKDTWTNGPTVEMFFENKITAAVF